MFLEKSGVKTEITVYYEVTKVLNKYNVTQWIEKIAVTEIEIKDVTLPVSEKISKNR